VARQLLSYYYSPTAMASALAARFNGLSLVAVSVVAWRGNARGKESAAVGKEIERPTCAAPRRSALGELCRTSHPARGSLEWLGFAWMDGRVCSSPPLRPRRRSIRGACGGGG
jgi:hypothetical protein